VEIMKLTALVLSGGLAAALAVPVAAHEQAIDLFSFDQQSGFGPWSGIVTDAHGTIFGTNPSGGSGSCDGGAGCGTIYSLVPPPEGSQSWTLNVLYDFQNEGDGWFPEAPLTLGPHGSLFGYPAAGSYGTVFQLLPPANGANSWTYQILYTFTNGADGNLLDVIAPLFRRGSALYGVASGGSNACGQAGCGSVFRLTPPQSGNGSWTEKTLIDFSGAATGGVPDWIVGPDNGKVLYVATEYDKGSVVEIAPAKDGTWSETVLTTFAGGTDGSEPSNLVLAADGTIYGTADRPKGGIVFQLAFADGTWTRTNIANVDFHGYGPVSLAPGVKGTLIGAVGGDPDFFPGNVFQVEQSGGTWSTRQLWDFNKGPDRNPVGVLRGPDGHLYGVLNGGDSDNGSVFELK
jgi:uncharacterized protein YceK